MYKYSFKSTPSVEKLPLLLLYYLIVKCVNRILLLYLVKKQVELGLSTVYTVGGLIQWFSI